MIKNRRRLRRRIIHHFVLVVSSIISIFAITRLVPSERLVFQLSVGTAYPALAYLVLTLILGPVNVLQKRRNPVSTDLRRDIGIWAAILGLAHVIFGLQVHLQGHMLQYFFDSVSPPVISVTRFHITNYLGVLAALTLCLLLALSNDLSLRLLGAKRWKFWQRANYILFPFVIVHAFLYQWIEERILPVIILVIVLTLGVTAAQLTGYVIFRLQRQDGATGD